MDPTKALIFRITHVDNLPWIFENGIQCQNSTTFDPNFVSIGNPELIERRRHREIPIQPGGMLSDYVSFYFTPFSPMMYNIRTGYGGITQRQNAEIAIVVSSMFRLQELELPFVFTDRHAYLQAAEFCYKLEQLDRIDWKILQTRDFQRDANDPEKVERYQAEALVHRQVPVEALRAVACYSEDIAERFHQLATGLELDLEVKAVPGWYFQ